MPQLSLSDKVQETKLQLQIFFSANRRKKVKMTAREWLLGALYQFRDTTGSVAQCPADPEPDIWHHHETRSLDKKLFGNTTATLVNDHLEDDGLVHTRHEYSVRVIYNAMSYTNGSTHLSVFDRDGQRLDALSYQRSSLRTPARAKLPVKRFVSGRTANLYGTLAASEGNYFHWFVDSLARSFLLQRFHDLDTIDYVLVPQLKYDFQHDSLTALGFKQSQIIELHPLDCIQFECLLASTPPRGKGSTVCPGWAIEGFNRALVDDTSPTDNALVHKTGKRIYVSRRDAPNRMFINEQAVCDFFSERGYSIVELTPLNLCEKIAVFAEADFIVSQTGAGLTNLMFCHGNARILELVNTRFVYPLYASMADFRGAEHRAHYFTNDTALGRIDAILVKSSLDIEELEKSLLEFGG